MSEKDLSSKQRTHQQNKSLHLGFQQIADYLIENNITLQEAFKNMEIRPTMEAIKDVYRQIAHAKYGVESTSDLEKKQIDQVWEDMVHALSINTGEYFAFPSEENTDSYLNSYEK